MVTLAQRIEELRTQKGLSRPALAAALGFPKTSIEKFETGRQTPSRDQQAKLASYFGVSLLYLNGESSDPTRQDNWMEGDFIDDEPAPAPVPRRAARPVPQTPEPTGEGNLFGSLLNGKQFQDLLRTAVLDVLRSPEGQDLLTQAIRRELARRS